MKPHHKKKQMMIDRRKHMRKGKREDVMRLRENSREKREDKSELRENIKVLRKNNQVLHEDRLQSPIKKSSKHQSQQATFKNMPNNASAKRYLKYFVKYVYYHEKRMCCI